MTKEAEYLLYTIYNEYLDRRAGGKSKFESISFGSAKSVFEEFFAEWNIEDITETLRELHNSEYVNCFFAGNTVVNFELSDSGISFCEGRLGRKVGNIIEVLSAIKSVLF